MEPHSSTTTDRKPTGLKWSLRSFYTWMLLALALIPAIPIVAEWIDQTPDRALKVFVFSQDDMVFHKLEGGEKVELTIGGRKAERPVSVLLAVANVGRDPVAQADIEKPVSVSFKDAEVLSAYVVRRVPATLDVPIQYVGDTLTFSRALLNPRDQVYVQVVLDKRTDSISTGGRVAGVSTVDLEVRPPPDVSANRAPILPRTVFRYSAAAAPMSITVLWSGSVLLWKSRQRVPPRLGRWDGVLVWLILGLAVVSTAVGGIASWTLR